MNKIFIKNKIDLQQIQNSNKFLLKVKKEKCNKMCKFKYFSVIDLVLAVIPHLCP